MSDQQQPQPQQKSTVKPTIKVGGILVTVYTLLTQLPEPYPLYVSYVLMGLGVIGLIGTQVPAPKDGSKWWPAYTVLSYLAANWGSSINYAMELRKQNKGSGG